MTQPNPVGVVRDTVAECVLLDDRVDMCGGKGLLARCGRLLPGEAAIVDPVLRPPSVASSLVRPADPRVG